MQDGRVHSGGVRSTAAPFTRWRLTTATCHKSRAVNQEIPICSLPLPRRNHRLTSSAPPTSPTYHHRVLPCPALLIRRPPPVTVRDRPVQLQPTTHSQGYPHSGSDKLPPLPPPKARTLFSSPAKIAQRAPLPPPPRFANPRTHAARRQSSAVHACRLVSDCYWCHHRARRSVTSAPPNR